MTLVVILGVFVEGLDRADHARIMGEKNKVGVAVSQGRSVPVTKGGWESTNRVIGLIRQESEAAC